MRSSAGLYEIQEHENLCLNVGLFLRVVLLDALLMFSAIWSEEMKNVGGFCITGSPRNPETCPVISSTTSLMEAGIGEGVAVGAGVGVAIGDAVGLGVKVCIGVGSGLGLVGVCRMHAEASETTAMNRSRKMAERE